MASTKEVKRRIKLVKTTSQITRAMELVAATKMRRAEEEARGTRNYALRAREILERLSLYTESGAHPLLSTHTEGGVLAIVISPERGLCGALSTNLFRATQEAFAAHAKDEISVATIGKRGQDFFRKRGFKLVAVATRLDWKPRITDVRAFAKIAIDGFLSKEYREVKLIFSNFISSASQEPSVVTLLPFSKETKKQVILAGESLERKTDARERNHYLYTVEPSPEAVLSPLIRNLVEMRIYQALLESNAAEHSARMIAMHAATDNAKELIGDLTLSYNRIRQETITRELAEITAGASA